MDDVNVVMNEFEQYCDSLNERCPIVLLDALELLKEQQRIIEKYHKADGFLDAHGWKWN